MLRARQDHRSASCQGLSAVEVSVAKQVEPVSCAGFDSRELFRRNSKISPDLVSRLPSPIIPSQRLALDEAELIQDLLRDPRLLGYNEPRPDGL